MELCVVATEDWYWVGVRVLRWPSSSSVPRVQSSVTNDDSNNSRKLGNEFPCRPQTSRTTRPDYPIGSPANIFQSSANSERHSGRPTEYNSSVACWLTSPQPPGFIIIHHLPTRDQFIIATPECNKWLNLIRLGMKSLSISATQWGKGMRHKSGIFSIMSSACMWGWYNQIVSQWDRDEQVTGLIGLLCQLACRVVSVGMWFVLLTG